MKDGHLIPMMRPRWMSIFQKTTLINGNEVSAVRDNNFVATPLLGGYGNAPKDRPLK
ncbi:hypothetical protein C7445_1165 [Alicyclobacillus sacchari]|uniref:Uncharacterized protein n=1 Tax=Alicyclobacillus sacchari TaxID=392010 RepID=A0A4R8LGS5_9BACL|nr:hypothetical protein C7445_1165 [Alicyclobacillus sacchari]